MSFSGPCFNNSPHSVQMFEYGLEKTSASDMFYIAATISSDYCKALEMRKEKLTNVVWAKH